MIVSAVVNMKGAETGDSLVLLGKAESRSLLDVLEHAASTPGKHRRKAKKLYDEIRERLLCY